MVSLLVCVTSTDVTILRMTLGCLLFLVMASTRAQTSPAIAANNNATFEIGSVVVNAGETYRGELDIPAGSDEATSVIPISIHNGMQSGPTLALIAGIHGSEYAPILSLQKLTALIDPSQLRGTLVIVHIANMPAFQGRTVYFGPKDLKNLNRSFPGDANGTITERIASKLTQEVIMRSDCLIDIHAGDANESLRPSYSAYYAEAGGEEVVSESRRIAVAFGLETIVQFAGSYDSVDEAIYTGAQALMLGIPAIDVESGELGSIADQYVDPITDGVLNVMRELNMIAGEPELPPSPCLSPTVPGCIANTLVSGMPIH